MKKQIAFQILPVILLTITIALTLNSQAMAQDFGDSVFLYSRTTVLALLLIFSGAVLLSPKWAKAGKKLFIRKIAGVDAVEEAVGRATEMGKPVLFIPGIADVEDIETIAGITDRTAILAQPITPIRIFLMINPYFF